MHNGRCDVRVVDSHVRTNILLEAKFICAIVHVRTNRKRVVKWASIGWRRRLFRTINPCWCPVGKFSRVELMTTSERHNVGRRVVDCNVEDRVVLWQVGSRIGAAHIDNDMRWW